MAVSTIFAPDSPLTYFALAIPGLGDIVEAKMESNLRKRRMEYINEKKGIDLANPTAAQIYDRLNQNQKNLADKVMHVSRVYDVLRVVRSALTLSLVIVAFVCPFFTGMALAACIIQAAPALIATVMRVYYRTGMNEHEQKETFGFFLSSGSKASLFYMFSSSIPIIALAYEAGHLAFSIAKLGVRQYTHYQEKKAAITFEKLRVEKLSSAEETRLLELGAQKVQAALELKSSGDEGERPEVEAEIDCSTVTPANRQLWVDETLRQRDLAKIEEFLALAKETLKTHPSYRSYWVHTNPQLAALKTVDESGRQKFIDNKTDLVFLMERKCFYPAPLIELIKFDKEQKSICNLYRDWLFDKKTGELNLEELIKVRARLGELLETPGSFLYKEGLNPQYVRWAQDFIDIIDKNEPLYKQYAQELEAARIGKNEEEWTLWLNSGYPEARRTLAEQDSSSVARIPEVVSLASAGEYEPALREDLDQDGKVQKKLEELDQFAANIHWMTAPKEVSETKPPTYKQDKESLAGNLKSLLCIPSFQLAIQDLRPKQPAPGQRSRSYSDPFMSRRASAAAH